MAARVSRSWLSRIVPANAMLPKVEKMPALAEAVTVTLPFPPSTNGLFVNNQRGGRTLTPRYRDWRVRAMRAAHEQDLARVAGGYALLITAQRPDRRARDLDNIVKAISDLLKELGLIDGDHLCQRLVLEWADMPPHKSAAVIASLVATPIRGLP